MFGRIFGQIVLIVLISLPIAVGLTLLDRRLGLSAELPVGLWPDSRELTYGSIPELKEEEYFTKAKNYYIDNKESFVEADLSRMILRVYHDGVVKLEVPIKTKGREGSWWETPAGIYQAQSKETNHLSSLGNTYMPWSIAFQGNFFIHGWPYYKNGTPVATTYSGGCIRLATPDAEKVYKLIDIKMPILVFEDSFKADTTAYVPGHSQVSAESYLVGDLKNDFIFTTKNKDEQKSIASITKLITAMVAVEYMDIERGVSIQKSALVPTSIARLEVGQRFTVYDLLHPMLEESSNEAALALSQALGQDYFISLMNKKAKAIGMENSTFMDPAGINGGNISTPTDLFRLGKYLYNSRQFVLHMTAGTARTDVYGLSRFSNIQNLNLFADDPRFVGGKVGLSSTAGNTGLFIFELPAGEMKRPVVIVLLNSKDLRADTKKLLDFVIGNYRLESGEVLATSTREQL
jgi:serine-type D-Ala-D-Ala carboxypeptidase (penicillin-binding protein 5/6)